MRVNLLQPSLEKIKCTQGLIPKVFTHLHSLLLHSNSSCNKLVSAVLIIYVWKVPNLVFIYTHTNAIALKEVNPLSCVDGCLPSWYAVTAVEEYIVLTL